MGRTSDAKDRLIEAAFDLIWTSSYGNVSVDQICEKAGVKKGSFYYFFPSKADLAVEALEKVWRDKRPDYDRIFSAQSAPLQRISAWCEYMIEGQREKAATYGRVCGCPFASLGSEQATQDEKLRGKVHEVMDRGMRYLESTLTDAQREGSVEITDPKASARQLYSTALGYMLQAKVENSLAPLTDMESVVMRVLGAKLVAA
jgi:TetR/AcrR family transcriptional regulator, transcriptional repressor for nem operon